MKTTDLLLLFVPQWSPFQPPLSLPSLAAWLRREGFSVECFDVNILFYEWLVSSECRPLLLQAVERFEGSNKQRRAYRAVFERQEEFRRDFERLRTPGGDRDDARSYLRQCYVGFKAFDAYLAAIADVAEGFSISPYDFRLKPDLLRSEAVEAFADDPPPLIAAFVERLLREPAFARQPRAVGLSCIGQEQLPFTLLLGRVLKERGWGPVLVGGTIFARLHDKGLLKKEWFGCFFDVIVKNEGERPCAAILQNLAAGVAPAAGVPGVVSREGDSVVVTAPQAPLKPAEIPVPDFDDMPLGRYFCPEITLPLLSSRGCYWGKCEFCHHGMVYGDRYSSYETEQVVAAVHSLASRYGVRHFAFNDEALPPKMVSQLGSALPRSKESGYHFTALIKFEKYFTPKHFVDLAGAGFRSLYVGLESASERVLALMRKPNKVGTLIDNLRDATQAGIWFHNFLFFGFPGETEDDAQQTYDFIMNQPDIIGSFGCGTFSLEHNAPIQKKTEKFGLKVIANHDRDLDVYYDYHAETGIPAVRASEWMNRLNEDASRTHEKYAATGWIPREMLLSLLSRLSPEELTAECIVLLRNRGCPDDLPLSGVLSLIPIGEDVWLVNRLNRRVSIVRGAFQAEVESLLTAGLSVADASSRCERLVPFLAVS